MKKYQLNRVLATKKKFSFNRALVAKKKYQLILIVLLLLPLGAMADDVLFKMVVVKSGTNDIEAATTVDMSTHAIVLGGGSATVTNAAASKKTVFTYTESNAFVRLESGNYLHIILPEALQVGDKINYEGNGNGTDQNKYILITRSETRARYNGARNQITPGVEFTVPQASNELAGASELWVWQDSGLVYINSLVITRASETVRYYDFEDQEVRKFTNTAMGTENTLVDGVLYVNNQDDSYKNAIVAASGVLPKALYLIGNGKNRSAKIVVTDPCNIEIFGWVKQLSSGGTRYVACNVTKQANASSTNKILAISDTEVNVIKKGSFRYDGLVDEDTAFVSVDGAFYIAAIRIKYDKVRPAADLAVTPAEITVRTSAKADFTISTSSNVTITRSKTSESNSSTVKFGGVTTEDLSTPSSPINGTVEGREVGTYVMTLTQPASADYRKGYAELTITVADEVERNAVITTSAGEISGGNIWTSTADPNMTFIEDGAGSETVRTTNKIAGGFTLTQNLSYTISVPTNKKITKVTITGYTNAYGNNEDAQQAVIRVDGEDDSAPLAYIKADKDDAEQYEPTSIVYSNLNASTFTFKPANYGIAAKLNVVIEESNKYPVTVRNGWASLCAPEDVIIPAGLTAYIGISGSDGNAVLLQEITSGTIRSNSGVVLAGADGDYEMVATSGGSGDKGILKYTTKRIANPNKTTTYCLNGSEGAFQQYAGNYIPANKAYYTYSAPAGAPAHIPFRIVQQDNTATGIENTEFVPIDYSAPIYNLQGQQVQVTESGIYMQNGRKYLIMK